MDEPQPKEQEAQKQNSCGRRLRASQSFVRIRKFVPFRLAYSQPSALTDDQWSNYTSYKYSTSCTKA
ncbi:hypothetical protein Ancab_018299 [Ancistrocladus abbreviatus]